jgi:hypothetical protein
MIRLHNVILGPRGELQQQCSGTLWWCAYSSGITKQRETHVNKFGFCRFKEEP